MKRKLEGATALEGVLGLGPHGEVVESGRWAVVYHRPLVLELLDGPRAVGGFLADVTEVATHALATLERAHVLAYRRRADEADRVRARLEVPGRPDPGAYLPDPE